MPTNASPSGFFQKATKKQGKLRVALTGPSGSGKTYSALLIAKGIGGKIAFVDTENRSASDYTQLVDFDLAVIDPPYTVEKYLAAIKAAETAGYSVLVIDSITHAWKGEGGLLEQKEALDARGGSKNRFANWGAITKMHEKFKAALLQCKCHLVVTMRSKMEYVIDETDGRAKPKKLGMAPEQRDGMEYEFTTVLDLAMNHSATASKDRTGIYDGKIFTPGADTGQELLAWRTAGDANAPEPVAVEQPEAARQPSRPAKPAPAAPAYREPAASAPAAAAEPHGGNGQGPKPGNTPTQGHYEQIRELCRTLGTTFPKEKEKRGWSLNQPMTLQMATQLIEELKAEAQPQFEPNGEEEA